MGSKRYAARRHLCGLFSVMGDTLVIRASRLNNNGKVKLNSWAATGKNITVIADVPNTRVTFKNCHASQLKVVEDKAAGGSVAKVKVVGSSAKEGIYVMGDNAKSSLTVSGSVAMELRCTINDASKLKVSASTIGFALLGARTADNVKVSGSFINCLAVETGKITSQLTVKDLEIKDRLILRSRELPVDSAINASGNRIGGNGKHLVDRTYSPVVTEIPASHESLKRSLNLAVVNGGTTNAKGGLKITEVRAKTR